MKLRSIPLFAILVIGVVVISGCISGSTNSDIVVQPTENVETPTAQPEEQEPPEQKIKSATLTIDRVTETAANLGNIRITIKNTGDVTIYPKFDVYVFDSGENEICSDSPLFGIGSIAVGKQKTDEIQIISCIFNEDGDYTVKVDLLDEDFNKLDTAEKTLTVNYWGQFQL